MSGTIARHVRLGQFTRRAIFMYTIFMWKCFMWKNSFSRVDEMAKFYALNIFAEKLLADVLAFMWQIKAVTYKKIARVDDSSHKMWQILR